MTKEVDVARPWRQAGRRRILKSLIAFSLVLLFLVGGQARAQDLEPRRWSRLPSGVSFIGLGFSNTTGDILFDPVLHIEDARLDYGVLGASFIRTFSLFGQYARVDVSLPYARGRWKGLLNGAPASLERRGLLDPSIRLSVNLYGAPALKGREFGLYLADHPVNTTVGAAIGVIAPLGEYFDDKLINLGSNRWAVRPQFGVLHEHHKWQFETTAAVFLYADNKKFYPGSQLREQDPLWSIQGHLIYTFRPGLWVSASGAYIWGGKSTIDGVERNDKNDMAIWALSLGVPINPRQGLKFAYINSETKTFTGSNLGTLSVAWSMMLGH